MLSEPSTKSARPALTARGEKPMRKPLVNATESAPKVVSPYARDALAVPPR